MSINNEDIINIKLYQESGIDESYNETPCNFFELSNPIFIKKTEDNTPKSSTKNISIINAKQEAEKIIEKISDINNLQKAISNFTLSPLSKFATHPITGIGIKTPKLLVITETPNSEEDKNGIPLSGATGELLKKILTAINCSIETNTFVFPASFLRPAGGRNPTDEEMEIFKPFIKKFIELLNPQIILTMGAIPTNILLNTNDSITSIRGTFKQYNNITLMATFSLPYLLNNIEAKKIAWKDLQLLIPKLEN